jgi:hypothetical protein
MKKEEVGRGGSRGREEVCIRGKDGKTAKTHQ